MAVTSRETQLLVLKTPKVPYKGATPAWKPIEEGNFQMIVRGLALNSICNKGFEYCCREIAKELDAEEMFDSFRESLSDYPKLFGQES